MTRTDLARYEDRALRVALVALAVTSVVTAVLDVPPAWQAPLILVALIVIIRLLDPVEEIHTDVRFLRDRFGLSAQTFSTVEEFYSQLGNAVRAAESTLDLTHIRDNPPDDFGPQSAAYSDLIVDWLRQNPARSARRIISIRTDNMLAWAQHLSRVTEEVPSYRIRVVAWSVRAPAMNMAVVDGKAVFLALTGETVERTKGLGLEDPTTSQYFSDYYSVLWNSGEDLDEYLKTHSA